MGASSIHTFDDDLHADWLVDLQDQDKPLPFFKMCLDLKGIDVLDYNACTGVLCTAVMIDGVLHGPTEDLPDDAVEWIEAHHKLKVDPLVPSAITGLKRVLEEDDAELNSDWSTNRKLYPKWKALVIQLRQRLEKAATRASKKVVSKSRVKKSPAKKKASARGLGKSQPQFDKSGKDAVTFAPIELIDLRKTEWECVVLRCHDWDKLHKIVGATERLTVDDYYINGYGMEGLVKACRLDAGLEPEPDEIDYDSEGGACIVNFSNLKDAVSTAQLAFSMLHNKKRLKKIIQVARDNDFED